MKNIFVLAILILLLPVSVQAELVINKYTNDFVMSSPNNQQLKLCSCETKVDRVIVENTGNFYAGFELEVQSSYPNIRLSQSQFDIAPKHFQEVLVYIEDTCGVAGTFDYTLTAVNSYGRIEHLQRMINIDFCEITRLSVTPDAASVGLCSPATFEVSVTNVGTYAEDYELNFGNYDDNAEAVRKLYLKPGEEFAQDVVFQLPCTEYGEKKIPFVVTSGDLPGPTVYRPLNVRNDYNFALQIPTSVSACADTTTSISLGVENIAPAPDNVHIKLAAPGFVTFEGDRTSNIELEANDQKEVPLTITPNKKDVGEYTVTIVASDTRGKITKARETTLTVQNCYEPALEIRKDEETVLLEPDVLCCGPRTYYVNVQNNGDIEQTFELSVEGPSFFALAENTITLQPEQNANIPLHATLPCTNERYEATVSVNPVGQPITASNTVVIESLTERACHAVQIYDDELVVKENSQTVQLVVENSGVQGGRYTVSVESAIFSIAEEEIELDAGERTTIHLEPKVDLSEQEKGRYLVFPTFTLNSIAYNEAVGIELREVGAIEKFFDWLFSLSFAGLSFCVKVILILFLILLVLLILLLLIYFGKVKAFSMARNTISLVKTILLAAIVVLLISFALLSSPEYEYEREPDNSDATVLEWYQNTQKTVNLDAYFDDPDMDSLVYTATQSQDIQASIVDGIMTLTPDKNFAGENTITITANDERGGVTDSPMFTLNVIGKKDLTLGSCLGLWCSHIFLLELVAIMATMLLIIFTVKEKKLDLKSSNVIVVVPKVVKKTVKKTTQKKAIKTVRKKPTKPKKKAKDTISVQKKPSQKAVKTTKKRVVRKSRKKSQSVNVTIDESDDITVKVKRTGK